MYVHKSGYPPPRRVPPSAQVAQVEVILPPLAGEGVRSRQQEVGVAVGVVLVIRHYRAEFVHRLPHGAESIAEQIADIARRALGDDNARQVEGIAYSSLK